MQGFIVFDYEKQYPQAQADLAKWLDEGKIQRTEYVVKGGIENAEKALSDLFQGVNTGKLALSFDLTILLRHADEEGHRQDVSRSQSAP